MFNFFLGFRSASTPEKLLQEPSIGDTFIFQ
jgi:hypothetical protein